MSSPKQQAFVMKYIDTFNPIRPSDILIKHLESITLPKSGYLNVSTRGKKLTELELDALDYLAYRCKQCPEDTKFIAKVLYFIKWYEELLENGDDTDMELYEQLFRENFSTYKIDFDAIFSGSEKDAKVIPENDQAMTIDEPTSEIDTKSVEAIVTKQYSNPFIEVRIIHKPEHCINTHCTNTRKFGGVAVNAQGYCEICHSNMYS